MQSFEGLETTVTLADTLATLAKALEDRIVPPNRRVVAAADSHCPDEGLALLASYIRIENREVRQAVLDAVLAISGGSDRIESSGR